MPLFPVWGSAAWRRQTIARTETTRKMRFDMTYLERAGYFTAARTALNARVAGRLYRQIVASIIPQTTVCFQSVQYFSMCRLPGSELDRALMPDVHEEM